MVVAVGGRGLSPGRIHRAQLVPTRNKMKLNNGDRWQSFLSIFQHNYATKNNEQTILYQHALLKLVSSEGTKYIDPLSKSNGRKVGLFVTLSGMM